MGDLPPGFTGKTDAKVQIGRWAYPCVVIEGDPVALLLPPYAPRLEPPRQVTVHAPGGLAHAFVVKTFGVDPDGWVVEGEFGVLLRTRRP